MEAPSADRLADLWQEVLTAPPPTLESDVFSAGGTSITLVHLAARIQEEWRVRMTAHDVVLNPTYAELHKLICARTARDQPTA
jgi:hypothetical protein